MSSEPAIGNDPFGRARLPSDFSREARVRLLGQVFEALRDGSTVPRDAAIFVGAAGTAWLDNGGDLCRDFFKVSSPRGSQETAASLWRALRDEDARVKYRDERQERSESGESTLTQPPEQDP